MESTDKSSCANNSEDTTENINERENDEAETSEEEEIYEESDVEEVDRPESPVESLRNDEAFQRSLDNIIASMKATDVNSRLWGMENARKMLSRESIEAIEMLVERGIVPICVQFLLDSGNSNIQYESAWALTNIAAGNREQTRCIVDNNAVPILVALLDSDSKRLVKQSVWALANIAADSVEACDVIMANQIIDRVLMMAADKRLHISLLRKVVWLMSNLCRNRNPSEPFDEVKRMLPVLGQFLYHHDSQVIINASWAFFYTTRDTDYTIQAVLDIGVVPQLIRLLDDNDPHIVLPALGAVGNIATGTDQQTDVIINYGIIGKLNELLRRPENNLVKDAAWTVSNITAGNQNQIQLVLDSTVFHEICTVLGCMDNAKAQKEAAWAVTNVTICGNAEQIYDMIYEYDILKPFCGLLDSKDHETVKVVLNGLVNIFSSAEDIECLEDFATICEMVDGFNKLEKLQEHENEEIRKLARSLINDYFVDDETESTMEALNRAGQLYYETHSSKRSGGNF